MATNKPRLLVTVDEEMFEMIDDFQHRNHYPNRSMAMEALLHAGLQVLKEQNDPTPKKPRGGRQKREPNDET